MMEKVLDFAVSERALDPGASGDGWIVHPLEGSCLLGVSDGIGHGPEAAEATRIALAELRDFPSAPLPELFNRCHKKLARTRGVVLSLGMIDYSRQSLVWAGVGNVEGVVVRLLPSGQRKHFYILLKSGTLGWQMPTIHLSIQPLQDGDLILFFSDGVDNHFLPTLPLHHPTQSLAEWILKGFGRENDDALVLVFRYGGPHA